MARFINHCLTAVIFLLFISSASQAANYTYLRNSALIGNMAGPDLLWDTADDFTEINIIPPTGSPILYTGFNPDGDASGYLLSSNDFGTIGGTFSTTGNSIITYNMEGTFTSILSVADQTDALVNSALTQTLTANTVNTLIINPDNTATSVINIDGFNSGANLNYSIISTGNYWYFNNGDDFNTLFAGDADLIAVIDYLLPLMPTNWETFFIGIDFLAFQGDLLGLTGNAGVVFYTSTVPLPPAILFFLSGITGLFLVGKQRKV